MLVLLLQLVSASPTPLNAYPGRYGLDSRTEMIVKLEGGVLTLRPLLARGNQPLRTEGPDTFALEERPDMKLTFVRSTAGDVSGLRMGDPANGLPLPRMAPGRIVPGELLFAGKAAEAARALDQEEPEQAIAVAQSFAESFPSRIVTGLACLRALARLRPTDPAAASALGDALVASGKRIEARHAYERSLRIGSSSDHVRAALRMLAKPDVPSNGWKLPFTLDQLFRTPTRDEMRAVSNDWKSRTLQPDSVTVVATGTRPWGAGSARVSILSHRVHGFLHHGALIVPSGAAATSCPVLVEARGVSWDYSPLDLDVLTSPRILKEETGRFIVLVPGFRGETLDFEGKSFVSEGDRANAWDGATDDLLAFLNAALTVTPEADAARIAAFGRSRGGSVALLAGIRDSRIRRVIDWAGPTDWFSLMGTGGFTQRESVAEGLRIKAQAPAEGGQFIERFLAGPIKGDGGLDEARHRMLASSPLWFSSKLPRTLAAYGVEDDMVPVRNGNELVRLGRSKVRGLFLEDAGHDLDRPAYTETKKFLLEMLR